MNKLFENWRKYLEEGKEFHIEKYTKYLPKKIKDNVGFFLGRGIFGATYEFGSKRVIKFEILTFALSKQEILNKYLSFLGHFVDVNYPNIAKIYNYNVIPIPKQNPQHASVILYIIMEKVEPLKESDPIYGVLAQYDFRNQTSGPDFLEQAEELLDDINLVKKYGQKADAFYLFSNLNKKEFNKIAEFAKFLVKIRKKGMIHFDLHLNNLMKDKQGNLVIIDHGGFLEELGLSSTPYPSEKPLSSDEDSIATVKQRGKKK
jgi:serine/threonine protein kinase